MSEDVPSSHNFFDNAYVTKWADEAIAKRPERTQFFEVLVNELKSIPGRGLRVLELGSGPGFLAEQLLRCCDIARYYLFDFSPPMNELSRARLAAHRNKTIYLHGNFKSQGWNQGLLRGFDVVVSLQAVHELRHKKYIPALYRQVYGTLRVGGVFFVCDHIRGRAPHASHDHYMTVDEHLHALRQAGFTGVREIHSAGALGLVGGVSRDKSS